MSDQFVTSEENQVNTTVAGNQADAYVATFEVGHPTLAGGHIIVWHSAGQDGDGSSGIYGQLYGANGQPVGFEFRVNENVAGDQQHAVAEVLANGDIIVAYSNGSTYFFQRLRVDNDELVRVGSEVSIDSVVSDGFEITALSSGGFVVTYQSTQNGQFEVFSRIYTADGTLEGNTFQPTTASFFARPDVVELLDGRLLYTYSGNTGTAGEGVHGRIFNSDGTPAGAQFTIDQGTGSQTFPQSVALENGGFVTVWHFRNGFVVGRAYDADGNATTDQFNISTTAVSGDGGRDTEPTITLLSDGTLFVAYEGNGNILGQRLTVEGTPIGDEIILNEVTGGQQFNVEAALNAAGDVVVSFQSDTGDGNGFDIISRVLSFDEFVPTGGDGSTAVTNPDAPPVVTDPADEHQNNTYETGNQENPSIATFSSDHPTLAGGHIIVWHSAGQDGDGSSGIYGQLYGANGQPVGFEFRVNENVAGDQQHAVAEVLANGDIIVAYSNGSNYFFQRLRVDNDELVRVGSEVSIDSVVSDGFEITSLSSGGFVVTYQSTQNGQFEVFSRIYTADGTLEGNTFQPTTASFFARPDVVELLDGRLLYTYSGNTGTAGEGVHGRIFNSDGTPAGAQFTIDQGTGSQTFPQSVALENGGFVTVWHFRNGFVVGRAYDADGNATTDQFNISTTAVSGDGGRDTEPTITLLSDGTLFVAYEGNGNILGQRLTVEGTPIGDEIILNEVTGGQQFNVEAALNAAGDVVVSFQSDTGDGNGFDIISRVLSFDEFVPTGGDGSTAVTNPDAPPVVTDPADENQVNTEVAGDQREPDVATFGADHPTLAGGHVIVWQSSGQDGDGQGVYGQLYGADGQPLGFEFQIDDSTAGDQTLPSVDVLANGNIIIVWSTEGVGSNKQLVAQEFSLDGTTLVRVGEERIIDDNVELETTNQNYTDYFNAPSIEALDGGGYAVTWFDLTDNSVHVNVYDGVGNLLNADTISNIGSVDFTTVSITELSDGRIAVGYNQYTANASIRNEAYVQIYSADGTRSGVRLTLNDTTPNYQSAVQLDALADGGFVAIWTTETIPSITSDAADQGVFVRVFDANGNPTTPDIPVAPAGGLGVLSRNAVINLEDGTFVVLWEQEDTGSGANVHGQRFTVEGEKVGDELIINQALPGTQEQISAELNAAGDVVISFQSDTGDGNGFDIQSRVLDIDALAPVPEPQPIENPNPAPVVTDPGSDTDINTTVAGDQTETSVATFGSDHPTLAGGHIIIWQSEGQDIDGSTGIYGQLYDANGQPVGGELSLAVAGGAQEHAEVAVLANGDFIVTYYGEDVSGTVGVRAQRFSYDGDTIVQVGDELTIDANAVYDHATVVDEGISNPPQVEALSDGGYVISWYDASINSVSVSFFGADDSLVHTSSFGGHSSQSYVPSVLELSDGRVLFTWSNYIANASVREEAYGRIYNADGTLSVDTFVLNSNVPDYQNNVSTAALDNGGFVATWHVETTTSFTGQDRGVFVRIFDANGQGVTADIEVVPVGSDQWYGTSNVTVLDDGTFVVFWEQSDAGSGVNIYGQRFDADGARIADSFVVHEDSTGNQELLDAELNAAGDVVVSFQSDTGDGNGFDIVSRVLSFGEFVPTGGDGSTPDTNPDAPPVVTDPADENQVNTEGADDQRGPDVGVFGADHPTLPGGHIIIWQSEGQDGDGSGVYGQLYDANGQPVGNEFRVHENFQGEQRAASVDVLENGNVLVVWFGESVDGTSQVKAQEFSYDGTTLNRVGEERVLDDAASSEDSPFPDYINPVQVEALDDGGYAVAWFERNTNAVRINIYDENDTLLSSDSIGGIGSVNPSTVSLTELSDGRIALGWNQYVANTSVRDQAHARIYNADGTLSVNTLTLNSTTAEYQNAVQLEGLANGGFVATWNVETVSSYSGANDLGVVVRIFDANGVPTSQEIQVTPVGATSWFKTSSLVSLDDGSFVIFWEQEASGVGAEIYGQRYSDVGEAIGESFVVNLESTGEQSLVNAEVNAAGDVVISFQSDTGDGNGFDIVSRVLSFGEFVPTGGDGSTPDTNPDAPPVVTDPADENQVNTEGADDQRGPDVGVFGADHPTLPGGHIIIWQSEGQDGDGSGVYGQLYDANGQPVGNEFRVHENFQGEQRAASVDVLENGNVLVVWFGESVDGTSQVKAQEFSYDGTTLNRVGEERVLDDAASSEDSPFPDYINPVQVEALDDGGYAVAWFERNTNAVRINIYDENDTLLSSDSIGGIGSVNPSTVSLTELSDGRIALGWNQYVANTSVRDQAHARIYNADGTLSVNTLTLNSTTAEYQNAVQLEGLANGGFVATWNVETVSSYSGANDLGVVVRIFDANGVPTSQEIQVTPVGATSWFKTSSLVSLDDGSFVIFWEQEASGVGAEIYGQRYSDIGEAIGESFVVNLESTGEQSLVNAEVNAAGDVVISFQSDTGDGNGFDIVSRVLSFGEFVPTGGDGSTPDTNPDAPPVVTDPADENQVNTEGADDQRGPDVGVFGADHPTLPGGHIIIWQSEGQDGDGSGVYGQLYDANGQPVGNEFRVHENFQGEQRAASVDVLENGNVLVVWFGESVDGTSQVKAQEFSYDGTTLNRVGEERVLDDAASSEDSPFPDYINPVQVEALDDGGYAVAWFERNTNAVRINIYDENDTLLSSDSIGGIGSVNPSTVSLTELSDGRIALGWNQYVANTSVRDQAHARIYNADGTLSVNTLTLNSTTAEYQNAVQLEGLANGGFVATWNVETVSSYSGANDLGVVVRIFDANGVPTSQEIQVTPVGATSWFKTSSLVSLDDGSFVIFWEQEASGVGAEIYGQRYSDIGEAIGESFVVNLESTGEQSLVNAEVNAAGDVVISFQSDTGDGNGFDIVSRVLNFNLDPEIINTDVPLDLASTEEDTAIVLTSDIFTAAVTDPDGDVLSVTTVSVDPAFGTVTDNGDGTFTYTPAADFHGEDVTLTFTVDDGFGGSVEGEATIDVTSVVDAVEDSVTTDENTAVSVNVLNNDTFSGTATLSSATLQDPSQGTLSFDDDGTVSFTPAVDVANGETVTVVVDTVIANGGADETATLTITLTAVNGEPLVTDVVLDATAEDTAVIITSDALLAGASDVDGDVLSVTTVSVDPAFGTVTDNGDGTFTYTPAADFHGEDVTLTFTVDDGFGGSVEGEATIDVTSVVDAVEDSVTTDENTAVSVNVLNNDTFSGTATLSSATLQDPSQGTLSFDDDGTVSFTPAVDVANGETVTVVVDTVIANGGADETATLTITLTAVNGEPLVTDVVLDATAEDTAVIITSDALLAGASDVDGDVLSVTTVSVDPAFGTITDNGDGTFTYTPAADFHGEDVTLTFTVDDGFGGSVEGEATIDVTSVADAVEDSVTTDENTAVSVNVLNNDTFSGTATLSSATLQDPSQGTLSFDADGTVSFTPADGFAAGESATVLIDTVISNGGADETSTITITVNGINDAAVIGGDRTGAVTEDEDPDGDGLLETSGQLTVSDVDGAAEESFVPGTFSGTFGSLSLDAAGNWSYAVSNNLSAVQNLDNGNSLTDTITVSSTDGTTQDVTVTISGVNEPASPPPAPGRPNLVSSSDRGSSSIDNVTNDTTPTFSINVSGQEVGTVIQLMEGINILASRVLTSSDVSSGSITLTSTGLSGGATNGITHVVTALATNNGFSTSSASLTLVIDTVAPVTSPSSVSVNIDSISNDTGVSGSDFVTSATSFTVNGSATPGSIVTVSLGGNSQAVTASSSGTFSASFSGLGDGNHTITATARLVTPGQTDTAGNTGSSVTSIASDTQGITIDTVAPTLSISDNTSGVADDAVRFNFGFSEDVFGFGTSDVAVSGGAASSISSSGVTVTPPSDASGTINVSVANGSFTDRAGNAGVGDSHNQGFDTELPNNAPTIVNLDVANDPLRSGSTVSNVLIARVDANDLDGDRLNFTVTGFIGTTPQALNTTFNFVRIDDNSAEIRATGGPVQSGFYSIDFIITDGNGGSVEGGFTFQASGEIFDGSGFLPIVLDLDGDGLELIDNHSFDVDGDGVQELTGFVGPDDGLLALDRDGNGIIDRGEEISFVDDLPGAETDLEGLRAFDTNGDGVLDSGDDQFDEFLVFQDLNGDGIGDGDELSSLVELGIASIDLTGTPTGEVLDTTIATGAILNTTTFTRVDGTTGEVGDAVFTTFEFSIEIL
ncbi:cadherin-like domain-containing protein [Kordiimonas sp. SCSIO 12603]|uniref:cadherin-like domain-containing protein n=1 Tax=Kordiimonas sp. SCSIO 12603 TaxID=2829596 RepID=UPI0021058959|nr:cadherin-like domain-containing protein [Kordiimonas sp. SCSIO 12603]UTW59539.1 cadherin-like domain-containing protein [Kordiimonas sp. SCSIO 12603]